ncbi:MAG: hypothetical protein ACRCYR_03755 [Phycicoccus sp.]
MSVVLPNAMLRAEVRAHPLVRDARGELVTGRGETVEHRGPLPGAVTPSDGDTGPEGGGWRLRADCALGPLTEGDTLVDEHDRSFRVRTAREVKVPGASDADFIRVSADLDPPERA